MRVAIEQKFPLQRFHATPWRQSAFDEGRTEWPPSPWRLLRALAARWFQYSRETGIRNEAAIEDLLRALASGLPHYHLPPGAERGPAIRQYQPTGEFAWSDPSAGSGAVKTSKRTLNPDQYLIAGFSPVYWLWEDVPVTDAGYELLQALLRRMLYFGRAESFCRMRMVESVPEVNCFPVGGVGLENTASVLVLSPGAELRLDALIANRTDRPPLRDAPIPPGTEWAHYQLPARGAATQRQTRTRAEPAIPYAQFAVGGHLYPPLARWIKVTERFRGRVLAKYVNFGGSEERFPLLAGKHPETGQVVTDHSHAYFILWPDENRDPSRLIVWRREAPFNADEQSALAAASETRVFWEDTRRKSRGDKERDRWAVKLVQLPVRTPLPPGFCGPGRVWESVTPFVPPSSRHAFRSNGRIRDAETPHRICAWLIEQATGRKPIVEYLDSAPLWMKLHEPVQLRASRKAAGSPNALTRPGYRLRLRFDQPVSGPIIVGDSCHFGLGLFRSISD